MEDPRPVPSFLDLGVDEAIRETLSSMGFVAPMEVQAVALQPILSGRDVVVQARTGSGKTAAFAIPFAQALVRPGGGPGPQALVLEPTRELALQVAAECGRIGTSRNLRVVPIYGGAPIRPQRTALAEGVGVVVGTPGRILDHMGRGWLRLDEVRTVVLDEGDEMLSRGFLEDIERILEALPRPRQTLLFSATVPDGIARLAERHQVDPMRIDLSGSQIGATEVQHFFYLVTGTSRQRDLLSVLEQEKPDSALIFCNTREETSVVASYLRRHGLDAEPISSDLTQKDRERVMGRMKGGTLPFLVATDVAARGIDITGLDLVVNYSFPEAPDLYVHRTGRTGRAGRTGMAISLVSPKELGSLYYLRLVHKIRPEERHLPTEAERRARWETERFSDLSRILPPAPAAEFAALAKRVWQSAEAERFVAGLLERFFAAPPKAAPPRRPSRAGSEAKPAEPPADPSTAGPAAGGGEEPRDFWERWAESKERAVDDSPAPTDEPAEGEAGDEEETDGGEAPAGEPTVRLYLNIGRKESVRASDIVALLRDSAGMSRKDVGRVQVRDSHTYASVPAEAVEQVIQSLRGQTFKGRNLVVERARR